MCIIGLEFIKTINNALSKYELREIVNYTEVFFIGDHKSEVHGNLRELNLRYDDDDGNYRIMTEDHLEYRYEILYK